MHLRAEDIIGYQVCTNPETDLVESVMDWIAHDAKDCRYFACLNPHAAEIAVTDQGFDDSLHQADFLTADGIGVVYASKILGGQIRQRVTGMDVFRGVTSAMNEKGSLSCFFLGSSEETLAKIVEKMAEEYPEVTVAGTYSPPFKPEFSADDNEKMIQAVNDSSADVLWVGLTAPKQEKWLRDHQSELRVNFAGPIGAAFDFFVGNINRVGPFWQKMGFEWLPRLIQEPRRLWKRSLVSAPKFFLRTFRYRFKARK